MEAETEEQTSDNGFEGSISATEVDPPVDPSSFERCIDICCQSCTCNFRNPFRYRRYDTDIIAKHDIMTPTLRRGRAKGITLLKQFMFPLVGPTWRIVWILLELLLVLVSMGFSLASFFTGSREVFHIVHLSLASVLY